VTNPKVSSKSPFVKGDLEAVRQLGFEEVSLLITLFYEPHRTTHPLPRREGIKRRGIY